jgi:hypothetical protein
MHLPNTLPLGAPVESDVALVALERGAGWQAAEWEAFANEIQRGIDAVVVAQDREESDPAFIERVKARASRLGAARVVAALLLVSDESGPERAETRRTLAETLRSSLDVAAGASLTVSAPELACPEFKHELVALAGTLAERSRGARVNVRFTRRPKPRKQAPRAVPARFFAVG